MRTDDSDDNLHEAALAIHDKAKAIREMISTLASNGVTATTKLRAIVAVANHNRVALARKLEEAFAVATEASDNRPILIQELADQKINLAGGYAASPTEIDEACVDGIELSIRDIVSSAQLDLEGNPALHQVDWLQVVTKMNVGILYRHLADTWDDCLWNEYKVSKQNGGLVFQPGNPQLVERIAATRARSENLAVQFAGMAMPHQRALRAEGLLGNMRQQDVIGVERVGRKQVIKLGNVAGDLSESLLGLLTLRIYASEPYYQELLDEGQPLLTGATLDQLLSGWTVLSGTAKHLLNDLQSVLLQETRSESATSWLPRYVPVLKTEALEVALIVASKCTLAQARAIIRFLTFAGRPGEELWAQPLVQVGPKAVAPVLAAMSSPNLRRLVDIWLRQLGVDLALRGPAFEAYMRNEMRQQIARSPLLSGISRCLETGLLFKARNGAKEEIDLVFSVGPLVFVCELKCILAPSEAKQVARHRKTVETAVGQVQRKVAAVEADRLEFQRQLRAAGVEVPEDFEVVPLVVLSGAVHAGYEIAGVGVADEFILSVFFDGELRDAVIQEPSGKTRTLKKTVLYETCEGAVRAARAYFLDPPQMRVFSKGLARRWVPIMRVSDHDWTGAHLAVSCIPRPDLGQDDTASNASS